MPNLKKDYLVYKRNVLNEVRSNSMNLTELRFFSIYLSRINPANPAETRVVRFTLDEFREIMELGSRLSIGRMISTTTGLLSKVVNVPDERGGYTGFQLFNRCKVSPDDNGEWYVEINAHDDALPLMFEFKDKFFKYRLWNALRLKSSNQLRMYEILKQYETIGSRVLSVADLKSLLGIGNDEYEGRWNNFKTYVLDHCQQALLENTDIKYTYSPHGKKGRGGKILMLKFIIEKNEDYIDPVKLADYIDIEIPEAENHNIDHAAAKYNQRIELMSDACDDEFSTEEIELLHGLVFDHEPQLAHDAIAMYGYFRRRYRYLNLQSSKKPVKHRFGYMKALIGQDI